MPLTHPKSDSRRWFHLAALLALTAASFCVWALYPVTARISAPVLLQPPPGLTALDPPQSRISVLVSGPRLMVRRLVARRPAFSPDLSNAREGVITVHTGLTPGSLPWGVEAAAAPATLKFTLDREVQKEVPTVVRTAGQPPDGYTVTAARADPSLVLLVGPESILSRLETAPTRPVSLEGRTTDLREKAALDLPGPAVSVSVSGPVDVEITIQRIMGETVLSGVPVEVLVPEGFRARVQPPAIGLTVKGPVDVLNALARGEGLKVRVDASDLARGVYVRRAVIELPLEAVLAGSDPEVFSVEIWKEQQMLPE